MIKIEKNVPIPDKCPNDGRGKKSKYPFEKMEVGDSFLHDEPYSHAAQTRLHNAARNFKNYHRDKFDWKFTVRKVEGNKIRVWRVK